MCPTCLGAVIIICNIRTTEKMTAVPSTIPTIAYLKHSNHSKLTQRRDWFRRPRWKQRLPRSKQSEKLQMWQVGVWIPSPETGDKSDDGVKSDDSEDFVAENIVGPHPFWTYRGVHFTRSQIHLLFGVLAIPKLAILSIRVWSLANARKNRLKHCSCASIVKKSMYGSDLLPTFKLSMKFGLEDGNNIK